MWSVDPVAGIGDVSMFQLWALVTAQLDAQLNVLITIELVINQRSLNARLAATLTPRRCPLPTG